MSNSTNCRDEACIRIENFRSMPALVSQLLNIMNDKNTDTSTIVETMRFDPGLTANVLHLANSAYFGVPRAVSSVNEAIVRLGVNRLFDLVIASGIGPEIRKQLDGYELKPEQLLQHSVWVAVASEEICKVMGLPASDMLFTAGILHDIGKVVIADFVGEHSDAIFDVVENESICFEDAESQILGINHSEAGSLILDRWNFPQEMVAGVRWHHKPTRAGKYEQVSSVIHAADCLAYAQGVGSGIDGMNYVVSTGVIDELGLTEDNVEFVASVTLDKMMELQELLRA